MKKCENKNCIMRTENNHCYMKVLDNYTVNLSYDNKCIHEVVGIKNIVKEIIRLGGMM